MEPRFTRGEYWLLETVVKREFEACALVESDLESFLEKKGHGLTRASVFDREKQHYSCARFTYAI